MIRATILVAALAVLLSAARGCFAQEETVTGTYETNTELFNINGYEGRIHIDGSAADCPAKIVRFKKNIVLPKSDLAPSSSVFFDPSWRSELVSEYEQYLSCSTGKVFPGDEEVTKRILPWVLSTNDMYVTPTKRATVTRTEVPDLGREVYRKLTPEQQYTQHTNVEDPSGFIIGTMFADDPEPKFDTQGTIYEYTGKAPEIMRRFRSLTNTSLPKAIDISLEITATNGMVAKKSNVQYIVQAGQMQEPVWDFVPKTLDREWYDDNEEPVILTGIVREYTADNPAAPYKTFGVDIPTPKFKLRHISRRNALLADVKDFFKSIPDWIALIEAGVIAFIGFAKLDWLKKKPDAPTPTGGETTTPG